MAGSKQTAKIAADRRARVEEMRKAQAKKQRMITALIGAGGGIIVIVIVVVIVITAVNRHSPTGEQLLPSGVDTSVAATTEAAATKVAIPAGVNIPGLVAYDTTGHGGTAASSTDDGHGLPFNHVDGEVSYSVTPPVGGDHNATWMNCGIYNAPVTTERAVHNLEHGAVWITYEPTLPKAQVSQLTAFVKKQSMVSPAGQASERFMDLTPWKDSSIGSPIVLSSWGFQLKVTSPTDPRMQQFVDTFRTNAKYTPELGSACNGQPVNISGQPISS